MNWWQIFTLNGNKLGTSVPATRLKHNICNYFMGNDWELNKIMGLWRYKDGGKQQ